MANYRVCSHCGANLDPEEKCDCQMGIADKEENNEKQEENRCQN